MIFYLHATLGSFTGKCNLCIETYSILSKHLFRCELPTILRINVQKCKFKDNLFLINIFFCLQAAVKRGMNKKK